MERTLIKPCLKYSWYDYERGDSNRVFLYPQCNHELPKHLVNIIRNQRKKRWWIFSWWSKASPTEVMHNDACETVVGTSCYKRRAERIKEDGSAIHES